MPAIVIAIIAAATFGILSAGKAFAGPVDAAPKAAQQLAWGCSTDKH